MNPGSAAATATVRVRRGGGELLSTGTVGPMASNGFSQVPLESFAGVGGTTDTNLWLEFVSDRPVLAYATIVHNVSGDPFAVVASADPPPASPAEETFTLPGGVPLVLARIPAGTFRMGTPETEGADYSAEQPVHDVTLTDDFFLGKYEVTQAQWQAVMGTNPSNSGACGGRCPVERVSWNDICGPNGFLEKLNALLGETRLRLPTEAEWERAARGGTQTRFSFGDASSGNDYCGANVEAEPYVWWCGNSGETTHEVGTKQANAYGLHDMHGNVWEAVEDLYGSYPSTPQTDPTGPSAGTHRVARGGGRINLLQDVRAGVRDRLAPDDRFSSLGFRIARSQ